MFKKTTLYSLVISLATAFPAAAEDEVIPPTPTVEEEPEEGPELQKFSDAERLINTLTADDQAALDAVTEAAAAVEAAAEAVTDATGSFDDALEAQEGLAEDATEEEIAAAQEAVDDASVALEEAQLALKTSEDAHADLPETGDIEGEIAATEELVGQLTEEQIFALNRSLNSAADGKLLVDIDAEDLQLVLDGNYNNLQINAFTQAYLQEARFQLKSDRFTSKYEETGNEKFLDQAARMEDRGASQKSKFEAKIDRFNNSPSTEAAQLAKQEAKSAAKSTAKETAKGAAKGAAKQAAKQAAKGAAKQAAKGAAKQAAKGAAKQAAKQAAKGAAKQVAREVAKGVAKSAAKRAAKNI